MHELVQTQVEPTPIVTPHVMTEVAPPVVEDTFTGVPSLEMSGAIRDEVTKLVHKLFLPAQGSHRVVFSATESGSGCTWMCARAALVLALQHRGSVCVVDANLRTPRLHAEFGVENHSGLSDALLGNKPLRQYSQRLAQNMWLLSSGSSCEQALTAVVSDRMRSRLSELRTAFDFVLIDAAPLNVCNEAVVLGGFTDGIVLTLKANSSRREIARRAMHEIQSANVRVLGAVLNQRTFPIPESLYKRL
jgi:polysaccharide biosynthesis transport protein